MRKLILILALLLFAACGSTSTAQIPPEMAQLGDWQASADPVQSYVTPEGDSAEVVTVPAGQWFRLWMQGEPMQVWCPTEDEYRTLADLETAAQQALDGEVQHGMNGPLLRIAECFDSYSQRRAEALE